ncbi:MAG TPA: FtsW/RodA/SpoVE family cell cycle protein [Rhabdochlamydiaceae bacterium]|nr:FtsW/RodA/SpoVE family cell cycle protein [Rhabdochlamydiaceae bacterium]
MDFRVFPLLIGLMLISLLVISAGTYSSFENEEIFFTPYVKSQLQWFGIGWIVYFFFSGLDYHKLREWTWFFYIAIVLMLIGVFFVPSIHGVHRWYRLLGFYCQPAEYAKLIVIITMSWFLEYKGPRVRNRGSALQALLIVAIPFILILKEPDLDTALVLYPIAIVMFYFGGIKKRVVLFMTVLALIGLIFVSMLFLGGLSHEKLRPT